MLRIIIAGLLGGVAMYIWSSLAHVVTPLGTVGVQTIPNEQPVLTAMQGALAGKPGLYMFPAASMKGGDAPGPSGLLVYQDKVNAMTPMTLGREAALELAEGVLAAFLLSMTALTGYAARAGFVGLLGVTAALATNPSYWIWYRFPTDYTLAAMVILIVGYAVAGLAIAAVLRPKAA